MPTQFQQVQGYLRDTLIFFRSHIASLAMLALPYAILSELANYFYLSPMEDANNKVMAGMMVEMLISPIYQSAIILYIAAALGGQQRTAVACYQHSVRYWPAMLMLTLITTCAAMAGLSLFVLPGVYILVRLCLCDMFCIMEQRSVVDSLKMSFNATAPFTWIIFLGLLILFPGITTITMMLGQLSVGVNNSLATLPITLVQALLQSLITLYLFRVYSAVGSQPQKAD